VPFGSRYLGPAWILAAGLAFAFLASSFALHVRPSSNEAWFADPARNLQVHGHLGTTILAAEGTWLEGIDRHTYWAMPVHLLAQAGWYSLFGFSLLSLRALSIAAGLALVAAWFFVADRLLGQRTMACVITLLLLFDVRLARVAANGRMDSLCAALGVSGLAFYLVLRTRSPRLAIAAGHAGVALSGLTHPCGAVYALDLLLLQCVLDGWRATRDRLLWLLAPYLVFGSAFALWALQDWPSFLRQFGGNISGMAGEYAGSERFSGIAHPWSALRRELENRYFRSFGGWTALAVLWTYAAGLVWMLFRPSLRSAARLLFSLASLHFLFFWLFEGLKLTNYLVHLLPLWVILVVLAGRDFFLARPKLQAAAVAVLIALQLTAAWQERRHSSLKNIYQPVVDVLRRYPNATITGPAEFAFAVGFDGVLRDDLRLGYFTRRTPDLFITNGWQRDWLERADQREPAVAAFVRQKLKSEFREISRNSEYVVWKRD
jgi:4-amino-4-deoxy-L-arabinose transferase-like glycosyltransferase